MNDQHPTPEQPEAQQPTAAQPATTEQPAAAAQPMAPQQPQAPAQPRYGEMAPEGWVSPVAQQAQEEATRQGAGRDPLVPHNLGAQQAPPAPGYNPQAAPMAGATPQPVKRPGDRIVTVLLLVIGAFFALRSALTMFTLGTQIEIMAEQLGATDLVVPDSIAVVQAIGAIVMLSIYAIALIWGVQRLRKGKLSFWVPLSAGVVAFIALLFMTAVGVFMVPELIEYSTPENISQLFEQLGQPS